MNENYGVSIVDVLKYFELQDIVPPHPALQDEKLLERALWALGLDISKGYKDHIRPHRSLMGTEENCLCFRGMERIDKSWLDSGYSSLEAVKGSSRDISMQRELERIRNRG